VETYTKEQVTDFFGRTSVETCLKWIILAANPQNRQEHVHCANILLPLNI